MQEECICRVCRCEATADNPLRYPCRCNGSIKYVHEDCLFEWLKQSKKYYCELCKTKFSFSPVYASNVSFQKKPFIILLYFIRKLHAKFLFIAKCSLIAFMWLIYVPWFSQQAWKYSIGFQNALIRIFLSIANIDDNGQKNAFLKLKNQDKNMLFQFQFSNDSALNNFLANILCGQLLTGLMTAMLIFIFLLREWYMQNGEQDFQGNVVQQEINLFEDRNFADNIGRNRERDGLVPADLAEFVDQANAQPNAEMVRRRFAQRLVQNDNDGFRGNNAEYRENNIDRNIRVDENFVNENVIINEARNRLDVNIRPERQDNNNADVIDINDNIEGLLEVLGFRGPIFTLYQNALIMNILTWSAIFCLVIVPGIWGEMVIFSLIHQPYAFYQIPANFSITIFRILTRRLLWTLKIIIRLIKFFKISPTILGIKFPDLYHESEILYPCFKAWKKFEDIFHIITNHSYVSCKASIISVIQEANIMKKTKTLALKNMKKVINMYDISRYAEQINSIFTSESTWIVYLHRAVKSLKSGLGLGNSIKDRFMSIISGYFFISICAIIIVNSKPVFGPKSKFKDLHIIEINFRHSLCQFLFIVKVLSLGIIEILIFPLVCGVLLFLCLLPMITSGKVEEFFYFFYDHAKLYTFLSILSGSVFLILFSNLVNICKKLIRPGVLFFIRDSNDPNFNPVREMFDQKLSEIIKKILISAIFYFIIIFCWAWLGVRLVAKFHKDLFPLRLQWSTQEYIFSFPIELLFFRAATEFIRVNISVDKFIEEYLKSVLVGACRLLRLSSFLFCNHYKDETGSVGNPFRRLLCHSRKIDMENLRNEKIIDGGFMKVPNVDRLPIKDVFFKRLEKFTMANSGTQKEFIMRDPYFTIVYVPNHFCLRVIILLVVFWLSLLLLSYGSLILPIHIGREIMLRVVTNAVLSDIYMYLLGLSVEIVFVRTFILLFKFFREELDSKQKVLQLSKASITVAKTAMKWSIFVIVFGYAIPQLFGIALYHTFMLPFSMFLSHFNQHETIQIAEQAFITPLKVYLSHEWIQGLFILITALKFTSFKNLIQIDEIWSNTISNGWLKPKIAKIIVYRGLPFILILLIYNIAPIFYISALRKVAKHWLSDAKTIILYRIAHLSHLIVLLQLFGLQSICRVLKAWYKEVQAQIYVVGQTLNNFNESDR